VDRELYPEPVAHRSGPIITGRVVRLMDGYPRAVHVGQPIVAAVLAASGLLRVLLSLLRSGAGAGARRRWKDLRKGPDFLVTPMRLRAQDGVLCAVEIHGHLPQSALEPHDLIQLTVRPQADPELAPRVVRIVNLTTGQLLTPRPPTVWSHLGPALLLQAAVGLTLIALFLVALVLSR
jgi:hypothetical protein